MLDIELLKLSDGKRGLREVFIDLTKKYGKDNPFPEKDFFNIFVEETYPEIEGFIEKYIRGSDPMPIADYFSLLGYRYKRKVIDEENPKMLGIQLRPGDNGEIIILGLAEGAEGLGLQRGDILLKLFGEEINFNNARSLLDRKDEMNIGDEYSITVKRGEEEVEITGKIFQRYRRHIFESKKELTDEESRLRNAWLKNM
jgi:predicted metalloprotease with PDZ domain